MSFFDLDPSASRNAMDRAMLNPLNPADLQPGWFSGAYKSPVTGLASALNDAALLAGDTATPMLRPVAQGLDKMFKTKVDDWLTGQQQVAVDNIKEWAPDPRTTGIVGQVTHGLFNVIPEAIAGGPEVAGALQGYKGYRGGMAEGLRTGTALGVGAIDAVSTWAGMKLPMTLGAKSAAATNIAFGAGVNVPVGMATRGTTAQWLRMNGYNEMADQYQVLDSSAVAVDLIMGGGFGALGHYGPGGMKRYEQWRDRNKDKILPSDVDAALTLNNQLHVELDTAPGIPATPEARQAHVETINKALSDLLNDRPVSVDEAVTKQDFIENRSAEETRAAVVHSVEDHMGPEWRALHEELRSRGLPTEEVDTSGSAMKFARELAKTGWRPTLDEFLAGFPKAAEASDPMRAISDFETRQQQLLISTLIKDENGYGGLSMEAIRGMGLANTSTEALRGGLLSLMRGKTKGGMSIDQVTERLHSAGWIPREDVNLATDLISQVAGRKDKRNTVVHSSMQDDYNELLKAANDDLEFRDYTKQQAIDRAAAAGLDPAVAEANPEAMHAYLDLHGDGLSAGTKTEAGADGYMYSRGDVPGLGVVNIWQGTTTRFGAEEGAPLGRFRWDMINSKHGEQAQVYGFGHYLAQQAWISQARYREKLLSRAKQRGGRYEIPDGLSHKLEVDSDSGSSWVMPDGSIINHALEHDTVGAAKANVIDFLQTRKAEDVLQDLYGDLENYRLRFTEGERGFTAAKVDGWWTVRRPDGSNAYKDKSGFKNKAEAEEAADQFNVGYRKGNGAIENLEFLQNRIIKVKEELHAFSAVTIEVRGGSRLLNPAIKEYKPPETESFRSRVLGPDGKELSVSRGLLSVIFNLTGLGSELPHNIGKNGAPESLKIQGSNATLDLKEIIPHGLAVNGEVQRLIDSGITTVTAERPGSLYQAQMAVEAFQNLARWDEPLSAQPKVVRDAFAKFGIETPPDGVGTDWNGRQAYNELASRIESGDHGMFEDALMLATFDAAARHDGVEPAIDNFNPEELASIMLNGEGVPGHAFLDGDTRSGKKPPAYNLVLYADDIAKIVARYARETGDIHNAASSPEGLREALKQSFGESTEALAAAGKIKIVETPDQIPDGPHPADVKAATAPDGTVYMVSSNLGESEARGLIMHEVGVHVGMETMLGPKKFESIKTQLAEATARGETWAKDAMDRVPRETLPEHVAEEQLAYLVQHSPDLPFIQDLIARVRAWAYKTFDLDKFMVLTPADFRAMAVAAVRSEGRAAAKELSVPDPMVQVKVKAINPATGEQQDLNMSAGDALRDNAERIRQMEGLMRCVLG